jgi:hypothetical protein
VPLPAALGDRLLRLRALEEYTELLQTSDVLAPAAAVAPRASSSGRRPGTGAPPAPPLQRAPGTDPGARPVLDLLHATLLIARHARPRLDAAACEARLAALAAAAEAKLPPGAPRYPLRLVRVVNAVLYGEEGFVGDSEDYYNPDNSCIDRVLARRRGGAARNGGARRAQGTGARRRASEKGPRGSSGAAWGWRGGGRSGAWGGGPSRGI